MASLKNAHRPENLSIEFANGDASIGASSMHEARAILAERYGPDYVENEDWESAGPGRDRLLIWANDADAEDDNGSRAAAEIIRFDYGAEAEFRA